MKRALLLTLIMMITGSLWAAEPTANEIIKKMDGNQVHKTSYSSGTMEISDQFGTRIKSFKIYSRGSDEMLMEFTNVEDAGQKILRVDDEIYLYFPEAEEIIQITGNALKDRVMGSDFSYEDLTGGKDNLSKYNASLEADEEVDGHLCYRIVLKAKDPKKVVYPEQVLWVDKKLFVYRKVHSKALSGKVVKEMLIKKIEKVGGKNVPMHMEMIDAMKTDSKTVFKIEEIKIDIKIDKNIFSFEELSW